MEDNPVPRTASLLTYFRAYHAAHDAPKIFEDFLAYSLLTEQERDFFDRQFATAVRIIDPSHADSCPDKEAALAWFMRAIAPLSLATSRARYAEELLAKVVREGVRQYVILGAGMDTFAFRCPELVKQLQVYEVDHPSMQACKRSRIVVAGWEKPEQLHFVPVDFARENPAEALARSPTTLAAAACSAAWVLRIIWTGLRYWGHCAASEVSPSPGAGLFSTIWITMHLFRKGPQ